jgi:hypothetical protein
MNIDNKIGFIGGWILTTASTITLMGAFKAALLGLIGGSSVYLVKRFTTT